MEKDQFNDGLRQYLMKCELEYRAKVLPKGSTVDWLEEHCNSVQEIAGFLRKLGFKVGRIMDEKDCAGELFQWVETTSGVIVYANNQYVRGFVTGRL